MGPRTECGKIQDKILTDYIDGRLQDKQKQLVERHLAQCTVCRELLSSLKADVLDLLHEAKISAPEDFLWSRIRKGVEAKAVPHEDHFIVGIWEKIRALVFVPKPAFALATLLTVLFMAGNADQLFMNTPMIKVNGVEQVKYISSLMDEPAGSLSSDSQTPIEKYFL